MTTWQDIINKPGWSDLDLATKAEVRKQWLEEDVAPALVNDPDRDAVLAELYNEPLDTGEGLIRSALGSAARGFFDPLAAAPEVAGAYLGIEGLEEFGGDVRGAIEGAFPVNPAEQGLVTDVAGVLGQVGQIVATGGGGSFVGGKLIGKGATELAKKQAEKFGARAAVQTAMGSSAVAGGLERAEQLGLEGGDRLLRGAIAGGTELLAERLGGFATELGPINKFMGQSAEEAWFKPIIRGVGTEALEEGGAEAAGQATDIAMAPEAAPGMDLKNIGYAMLLGGVGGAAFGGIEAAITPRTKKAFDGTTDFIPSSTPPPGMTAEEAEEQDLLKYGNAGEIIGYVQPQAPVTAETIEAELPVEIAPAVAPLAQNVAATPEASATASALRRIATEGAGAPAATKEIPDEIVTDETTALRDAGLRMLTGQPAPVTAKAEETVDTIADEWLASQPKGMQEVIESNVQRLIQSGLNRLGGFVGKDGELDTGRIEAYRKELRKLGFDLDIDNPIGDMALWKKTGVKNFPVIPLQQAQPSPVPAQAETVTPAPVAEEIITEQEDQAALEQQQQIETPISEQPANVAPRASNSVQPRPERVGRNTDARDAWDEQFGSLRRGGRTHNDDGTPYQPTVFDEVMGQVTEGLKGNSIDENIDAIGVDVGIESGTAVKQLLNDGWVWDEQSKRMVDTKNRGESPASALRRIRSRKGQQQQPTETNVPLTQETLQQEQSRGQELQEPRELPILPAEQVAEPATSQAPEAAVGDEAAGERIITAQEEFLKGKGLTRESKLSDRKVKALEKEYQEWLDKQGGAFSIPIPQQRGGGILTVTDWKKAIPLLPDDLKVDLLRAVANNRGRKSTEQDIRDVMQMAEEMKNNRSPDEQLFNESNLFYDIAKSKNAPQEIRDRASQLYKESGQSLVAQPEQEAGAAVDTQAALDTQGDGIVRDEGIVGADVELEQQKATLPVDVEGAMLQGGDVRKTVTAANVYSLSEPEIIEAANQVLAEREARHDASLFGKYKDDAKAKRFRKEPSKLNALDLLNDTLKAQAQMRKRGVDIQPITIGGDVMERWDSLDGTDKTFILYNLGFSLAQIGGGRERMREIAASIDPAVLSAEIEDQLSQQVSAAADVPTESLPATGQLTPRGVGVARDTEADLALEERLTGGRKPASWVIRNKTTGEVVMETFDKKKVSALNKKKYEAIPIGVYLSELNATPPPPAQPQPATPATQETKPQTATLATQPAAQESTAAQSAAGETGDAGVAISPTGETDQSSETPLGRLQSYISTLSPKAQAAWTPERLEAAQSYYATGNESALEPLTATQRKIVMREGTSESDAAAYEAEQKRQFALRNPPAATDSQFLEDYNAYVNSLSDETLQQERESREKAPDETPRYKKILRSADGDIRRTGVKSTPARAARNSYIGVIPGVENTWLGTVEEFDAEFPDGYPFDSKTTTPPADTEALVAEDGRAFIFIDRVAVLDGDAERAEQHGTSPGVEAIKRLLRHESFIHRGYMALPGPLKNRFADFVASGIIPPEDLDFLVNNGYPHYKGWRDSKSTEMLAAEEWLAQRVERMGRIPQSGPIASIMDWLRDVWRWLTGGETTDLDKLRNTMRAMHKALGALDPKQRIVMELPDMDVLRRSVAQTQQDQEYLAAVERGDSGSDNLVQLLRDAPESERKAVVDAWMQRNPAAAERLQRMVDEAARAAGYGGDNFYHGTVDIWTVADTSDRSKTFDTPNAFGDNIGLFLTNRKGTAEYFARSRYSPSRTKKTYDITYPDGGTLKNAAYSIQEAEQFINGREGFTITESSEKIKAEEDEQIVFKFKNNVKNPKKYKSQKAFLDAVRDGVVSQESLIADGYDGVLIQGGDLFSPKEKWVVIFSPNQIKSADPVTYDSNGAPIPLSQRFQSTSSDIRYSKVQRPDPILTQPSRTRGNVPQKTKPNALRRSVSEIFEGFDGAIEIIPRQYFPMGSKEKGNEFSATEALLSWSKDLLKPYAEDIGGLIEFLAILRSDERLQNELKLGPRSGAVVMPFLAQEAANRANALGSTDMRNAFLMEYDALGTAGGQNLWAFKVISKLAEFSSNTYSSTLDKTEEQNFAAHVDKKINGEKTIQDVVSNLPEAGEVAADNVSDGLAEEEMIRLSVLELGVLAQDDAELRDLLEELIATTLDLGEMSGTPERASIAARRVKREFASEEEKAVVFEQLKSRQTEILQAIQDKLKAKKADTAKTPAKEKASKPIETAKEIINKITTAAAKVPAKKKQPDAVRSLYRKHLKKPMSEAEFSAEAKAAGLDAATTNGLYDAINLEIVAIEIQAQAKAAERAQTKELKKAEREAEKYQNQAEAKINEIAEALADPSLTQDKEKVVNPLTEIYQNQIKTPITEAQFVEQVVALGVDEETATLLFSIAAMDRQARIDIRVAREDLRRREMSEAQASKLIYAQEEELRQGSKDREPSKSGDSINKAFREQVVNPLSQEKFRERLDKLKVSQKLADRLYATAERVATDNERAEAYRKRVALLDVDSAALTRFVNDLRLKGKLTGEPIQWRDLLSLPVAHQDTVKAELLARVKRHEALRNLSTGEQQAIADALNTIWQRERRKVFQAMIKKADLMGVSKEDQEVIVEAMPALLKYINQGMLGTSAFYRAVGEKFGIAPISAEARKQVEEMAAKMQEKELYSFERAVLAEKILKILQNNTQLSRAEILSSFWVTSVLSGGRTIFDMALGVLNGGFSIAKKMITATIETRSPKAAIEGLTAFGQGIWMGAQVAAKNLIRPEEGLLASRNPAVADYFDDGARGAGLTTGDKLLLHKGDKPKDKLRRGLGVWMSFFERLFSGLDHINSTATMMGTMRMAAAMNPKLYNAALTPTKQDYANALERAKLRLPDGSNAAKIRLAQSIIEDGQHILERGLDESFMSQWRQLVADSRAEGNTASYQEDPTGAGGLLYSMVRNITSGLEDKTKGYRNEARVALAEARKTGRGVATSAVNYFVASLGYLLGTQAQNLLGVRFMRFTGNKLNELISFIPVLGMARLQEKGMVSGENYTLRGQNVRANQVLGYMSAFLYFMLLNDLDEEDDEERGWIVNGSWENLTPERKSQLMSDGFKPNTVAFFDKDTGRWTSYNFVSWPFAGWMAAFGSVSDYKRLTPDKWNEKVLIDKTMAAAYAGAFAITDISSLSSLTEMFGRSTYTTDPAEGFQKRVVKGAANYLGGFFPKTLKDVDAWFDETNYKPEETWEHFAKEVPFYRRTAGAPLRDIFYEPVQVSRTPWSRALQVSPDDPAYKALGRLNSRGIWLTPANPENRKVKRGGKLRDMTDEESNAYMSEVGKRYKEFVMKQGDRLLEMDVDRADELVSKYTARIREIAFKKAIASSAKAATR